MSTHLRGPGVAMEAPISVPPTPANGSSTDIPVLVKNSISCAISWGGLLVLCCLRSLWLYTVGKAVVRTLFVKYRKRSPPMSLSVFFGWGRSRSSFSFFAIWIPPWFHRATRTSLCFISLGVLFAYITIFVDEFHTKSSRTLVTEKGNRSNGCVKS